LTFKIFEVVPAEKRYCYNYNNTSPGSEAVKSINLYEKIEEKIKIIIAKVLQQMLFKTVWVTIWSSSLVFTLMKPVTQYFFICTTLGDKIC
jgi:hypothetical protein